MENQEKVLKDRSREKFIEDNIFPNLRPDSRNNYIAFG